MTTDPNTQEPQTSASENGSATPPKSEDPPSWFAEFATKTEKQMGDIFRRFGKLNDKIEKPSQSNEASPKTEQASVSRDELFAAMKFGEMQKELAEPVREKLAELHQSGASFSDLCRFAEIAKLNATGATPQKKVVEPGMSATAAPNNGASGWPQTLSDYLRLGKEERAKLLLNPNFDPRRLSK